MKLEVLAINKTRTLLSIYCECCSRIFFICRSCYRNHVYCSKECREAGYRQKHRLRQRKYRDTGNGQGNHRKSEKLRRGRSKIPRILSGVKTLCACIWMKIRSLFVEGDGTEQTGHCVQCGAKGMIVEEFSRRGYGKGISKEEDIIIAL